MLHKDFIRVLAVSLGVVASAAPAGSVEPSGWVLIAFEPAVKGPSPFGDTLPEGFGTFTLRGRGGGGTHESPSPLPKVVLFQVPAGRYCVDRIRIDSRDSLSLCRDAASTTFEVGAGEFVNLGRWEVDVLFDPRNGRASTFRLVNSWGNPRWTLDQALASLSPERIAEVRAASPRVDSFAALAGSRWYRTTGQTVVEYLHFLPLDKKGRGEVEVHQLGSWANRSTKRWRIEGDELLIEDDNTVIRARLKDGVLDGIDRSFEEDGVLRARSEWRAGTDPFFPAGFETGPQPRLVGVRKLELPADFPDPLPTGRVVVRIKAPPAHFGRLGFRALWSPHVELVIESDPPGLYDEVAKDLIRQRFYTPAMVSGMGIERVWTETLEFPAVLDDVPLRRKPPQKKQR